MMRLPPRQLQVLELLADGLEVVGIAAAMSITPNTVRAHKRMLFEKLDVYNSAHAVAEGFRLGLLTIDEAAA